MNSFKLFETVALERDVANEGLRAGDVGTVVELLDGEAVIVEFMTAAGDTRAVLTLATTDVRKVRPHEMLAVREP